MNRMSFSETIFLFFLALVIFGPKKLPEIARQVGKVLNEFRRASNEFKAQIEQEISHLELEEKKRTMLPASPAPENTASRTLEAAPSASSTASEVSSAPAASVESPAPSETAVAADDEPLFATGAAADATETVLVHPESTVVKSGDSQESHA